MAVGFADALGTGLFLPLSVIYLTRIVGLSAEQIGIGLTVAGVLGVAATPLSGTMLDRVDARTIVGVCFAVNAVGFLAYAFVNSFASFLVVAIVVQVSSRVERPATAVLVLDAGHRSESVLALAWQQTLRNLGYGVGGLLAALLLLSHGRLAFDVALAGNAVSYLVAGALVMRLHRPPRDPAHPPGARRFRKVLGDRGAVNLAGLNVLVALHDSMLRVAMPLWIVTRTHAPPAMAGVLFALNTLLIVAGQVHAGRGVATRGGIGRSYLVAAASLIVCGVSFALAGGAPQAVAIAFLILGLTALTGAELENTAGEALLSVGLAPLDLRGHYISLFKTSMGVQQAVGPVIVTTALVWWGGAGWVALSVIAAAGALLSRHLSFGALRHR